MERHAIRPDDVRQHLSDDAVDGVELLEPDQVQRASARRRVADVDDAQGSVHALRRPGLSSRVPRRRRHRPVQQRDRRLQSGELHRLSVLRDRLSIRYSEVQFGDQEGLQVHAVFGSRRAGARARVHQGVSDRLPEVRHEGRTCWRSRKSARRSCASILGLPMPASTIRRRSSGTHVIYVLHDATNPEMYGGLPANPEDSNDLHDVEVRWPSRWDCCWLCSPRRSRSSTTSPKDRRSRSLRLARGVRAMTTAVERFDDEARRRVNAHGRTIGARWRVAASSGLHARAALGGGDFLSARVSFRLCALHAVAVSRR